MPRNYPSEISVYFFLDVLLVFLLINYNMPLATIYSIMVIIGSIIYLVPIQFNFFRWIPFNKGGSVFPKVAIGVIFGMLFIYFYERIALTPMAAIFATTAFGDSKILTILVYSFLIAIVETRFFFRTLMQWWAWKIGDSVHSSPFSSVGIKLMIMFGAVFTIFHATAKGIDNTLDLAATFIFGALSVGMILYFQEWIQALVMHIVVNSKSMGLFEIAKSLFVAGNSVIYVLIAGAVVYYFTHKKKVLSLI